MYTLKEFIQQNSFSTLKRNIAHNIFQHYGENQGNPQVEVFLRKAYSVTHFLKHSRCEHVHKGLNVYSKAKVYILE